jgi:gliding motility-associated-like protein
MFKVIAKLFILVSVSFAAHATHIVGGNLSLQHINGNQYSLQLKVLRDCVNGQAEFDRPATIGMFNKTNNQQVAIFSMTNLTITNLNITGPDCAPIPSACTELGLYTRTVNLPTNIYNSTTGYYFVYMRCCRNNIINNIFRPQDAGIAIYMEIPPLIVPNSTPKFSNNPFTYLCTSNLFNYNFNFTDADGDSLVYSMITPLNGNLDRNGPITSNPTSGPYPNITWLPAFNDNQQILGNPALNINAKTGEIEVNPIQPGIYVSAIKVEEYRFGVKLGEVRLELQFNITVCSSNLNPEIIFKNLQGGFLFNSINVRIPDSVCFDIEVSDPTDSLYVSISGSVFSDTILSSRPTLTEAKPKGFKKAVSRFCWQTNCELSNVSQVKFDVEAIDNGCPFPKKSKTSFVVNIIPMPLINPIDLLCVQLLPNEIEFEYGDSTGNQPLFSKYFVYRSLNNGPFALYDSISDKSLRKYLDLQATNNRNINHAYYIRALNQCRFLGPTSDTISSFQNLEQIPKIAALNTVTVEQNKFLRIEWPVTPETDFARYSLYKSKRGEESWMYVSDFLNKDQTTYLDNDVNVQETSYCYYIVTRDTCQNISDNGKPMCSILLNGTSSPFEHNLNWTPFNYWANGTKHYEVFRQDHLNPFRFNNTVQFSKDKFKDEKLNYKSGLYQYYVVAQENPISNTQSGVTPLNFYSQSNNIELIQSPYLYEPNAFTPNGDALNENFGVMDVFVKDYELKIYNRWGQLVFETHDKNVLWEGKDMEGNYQPTDVYVYLISYTGWDDSVHSRKGNVSLLR